MTVMLSPRVLYFSPTQLTFFYPRSIKDPQTIKVDGGIPFHSFHHRSYVSRDYMSGKLDPEKPWILQNIAYIALRHWLAIIQEYTRLQLCEPGDKLLAFSATAEVFGGMFIGPQLAEESYKAGLWTQSMPLSLLWGCTGNLIYERPSYRAPSWSWASIDGPIASYFYKNRKEWPLVPPSAIVAKVLECHVQLATPTAPYGQVLGGHIQIEGLLKSVPLSTITDNCCYVSDPAYETSHSKAWTYLDAIEQDMTQPSRISIFGLVGLQETELECHKNEHGTLDLRWLLLREVEGQGVYSRIGVLCINELNSAGLQEVHRWQRSFKMTTITIV
jgi:hypothetical protein